MNSPTKIDFFKKIILGYWNKLLRFIDRDKFKSGMSPEEDWALILSVLSAMIVLFIVLGAYLYMTTQNIKLSIGVSAIGTKAVEVQKIKNALNDISKAEMSFDELIKTKPSFADPSI